MPKPWRTLFAGSFLIPSFHGVFRQMLVEKLSSWIGRSSSHAGRSSCARWRGLARRTLTTNEPVTAAMATLAGRKVRDAHERHFGRGVPIATGMGAFCGRGRTRLLFELLALRLAHGATRSRGTRPGGVGSRPLETMAARAASPYLDPSGN